MATRGKAALGAAPLWVCAWALTGAAAAPGPAQDGKGKAASAAVECERPGPYVRHVVRLNGALGSHGDLVLHLGVQDGRLRQSWAACPSLPKDTDYVDVSQLRLEPGRLRGTVKAAVRLPLACGGPEGPVDDAHVAEYRLDVRSDGGRWSGTYEGWFARRGRLVVGSREYFIQPGDMRWAAHGEKLAGRITGAVKPLARAKGTVAALLRSYGLLKFVPSGRLGNVDFLLTFRDGRSVEVGIRQGSRGQGLDRGPEVKDLWWTAAAASHAIRIAGDRLAGRITADVTPRGKAPPRRYEFELDARLQANSATGRVKSACGEEAAEEGLIGKVDSQAGAGSSADGVFAMALEAATIDGRDVTVELVRRAGKFTGGVVRGGGYELSRADAGELGVKDGRLVGKLKLYLPPSSYLVTHEPLDVVYDVDVAIGGKLELSGTYAGVFGRREAVKATAEGITETGEALRKRCAIAPGRDFPSWIGPNCNFSPISCGDELVEDLSKARLAWKSEHTPPGRLQTGRYGDLNLRLYAWHGGDDALGFGGGCGSPIVYDGKVYLHYVRPIDGAYAEGQVELLKRDFGYGLTTWTMRRFWAKRCDDVVLCADGATGETLWKAVFCDEGPYAGHPLTGHGKRSAYTTFMAGGAGRVFAYTTGGKTVCLDAATGKLLWSSPLGNGELKIVVDGVLATSHGGGACPLIGLDAETGRKLWEVPGAGTRSGTPLAWAHEGSSYVIAGNETGKVVCVEPRSGRIVWQEEKVGVNRNMTLAGDYLLCNVVMAARGPQRLGALKISLKGLEKVWTLDEYAYHMGYGPTAHGNTVYLGDFRKGGARPTTLVIIDLPTGKVLGVVPLAHGYGSGGQPQYVDGRVLMQRDSTHNQTDLNYFHADGRKVRPAGSLWHSRHFGTSGYSPVTMTNPIADGRLIIRGGNGIWCYDLRKPSG